MLGKNFQKFLENSGKIREILGITKAQWEHAGSTGALQATVIQ